MNIAVTKEVIAVSSFVTDNIPDLQEIARKVGPEIYSLYIMYVVSYLLTTFKVDRESKPLAKLANFASYPIFLVSASLVAMDIMKVSDELSDIQLLIIISAALTGFITGFVKNPHFGENGVMEMSNKNII